MELEELKQKWDILSKEVEKQKIINKKLMDNVVNQRLKGLISYNWLGFALSILVIPFVYYLGKRSGLSDLTYIYIGLAGVIFFMIWGIFSFRILLKAKFYNQDLISAEKTIIKYRKSTTISYLCQYIFIIPYLVYCLFTFKQLFISAGTLWVTIFVFLGALAFTVIELRWNLGKINNLQKSISELKEFEKE